MTRRSRSFFLLPALTVLLTACAGSGMSSVDSVASLSADGQYSVMTYTDFPDVPEFGAGTIYYPVDAPGAVGGVAVLILDTNDPRDRPDLRADALMAAVGILKGENGRLAPWEPEADLSNITVPTLVMAGSADRIAPVEEHSWRHFNLIPESTTKVYMEVDGGDHYIADTTRGTDLPTVGRYAIAWLKLYVDGDESYREFIYGDRAIDAGKFTRYVTSP